MAEESKTAPSAATRMPTFFISHGGGPSFFIRDSSHPLTRGAGPDSAMARTLAALGRGLPKPKALLIISAHWETRGEVAVTTAEKPPLLFDYYGFPDYTYKLKWPAPGDPALARRVQSLLKAKSIPCGDEKKRGFDHGVFIPMLLAYPAADIPTLCLSLRSDLDPEFHLQLGEALAPLRDEGVLIIGSGFSTHGFFGPLSQRDKIKAAADFDAWLQKQLGKGKLSAAERRAALVAWSKAPGARGSHPREEHLLPLHVVAGAGGEDASQSIFNEEAMGVRVSMFRFG